MPVVTFDTCAAVQASLTLMYVSTEIFYVRR